MKNILYKYFAAGDGISVLQNEVLWTTDPLDFNDPFEIYPIFDQERRETAIKSRDQFGRRTSGVLIGSQRADIERDFPQDITLEEECHLFYFENISMHYRVLCLSGDPASILMWSHYGNSHKGMVIGFDVARLPSGERPGGLKIDYLKNRSSMALPKHAYYLKCLRDHEAVEDSLPPGLVKSGGVIVPNGELERQYREASIELLTKKDECWEYEDEYRFIYDLRVQNRGGLIRKIVKNKKGEDVERDVIEVPRGAVAEVRLGRYFPPESAKELFELLKTDKYNSINLFRASLHPTEFKVEFGQVDKLEMLQRYELFTPGLWRGRPR